MQQACDPCDSCNLMIVDAEDGPSILRESHNLVNRSRNSLRPLIHWSMQMPMPMALELMFVTAAYFETLAGSSVNMCSVQE